MCLPVALAMMAVLPGFVTYLAFGGGYLFGGGGRR